MTLVKTTILSAIASVIRIVTGLIVTKVIAVYVGPAGLAVIGQLQNFISLVMLGSGNFFRTALTKYTAEYKDEESKKFAIWSAALKITFILNIVAFLFLFTFSENISNYLLKSSDYTYILKLLSISLLFFVLNTILLSILNGQKQIRKYIVINILSSIVSLLIVAALSVLYGLDGALVAYVTNQSLVFFITLYYLRNEPWLEIRNFMHKIKKEHIKKLFGFAVITFVAIMASNLSMIYIRDYITETISLASAGYWQGIWSLSQVSISLISTSLATYFLPTLSGQKDKKEITKELIRSIYFILPIASIISLTMYLLRDFIIMVLYADEFMAMNELFLWQMIGNVIKVLGWLFGYVLVAKAMVKYTVATEVVFAITFIFLTTYFIGLYGLIGVTYAFAMNSFLHFITMLYLYRCKVN